MACRFCYVAQGKVKDDYVLWQDKKFLALLDVNPAKPGHCMLIPKKHVDDFFDLGEDLYTELFLTAKKLAEPLKIAMNAKKIGIAIVGFAVPHAHLHLVPLHGPHEMFDEKLFAKAKHEDLIKIQKHIQQYFKNI